MVTLAYLGRRLRGQLSGNPEGLSGVDVVWQGTEVGELMALGESNGLSVLVTELEALGNFPVDRLDQIRGSCNPELTLVLHHFAKRELLSSLLAGNTRTLQAPVSLSALRSQMLSLIVRDMLSPIPGGKALKTKPLVSSPSSRTSPPRPSKCPQCGAPLA